MSFATSTNRISNLKLFKLLKLLKLLKLTHSLNSTLSTLNSLVVHPKGIEPLSKEPESFILSIELRVQQRL